MPQNLQQIGNIWPGEPYPLATQIVLQELGHTLQKKGIGKQPTPISSNLTVLQFDSRFYLGGTFKTWSQGAYFHWLSHFQVTSVSVASCTTTHWLSHSVRLVLISKTCTMPNLKIGEGWNLCWVILNSWIHAHFPHISRKSVHAQGVCRVHDLFWWAQRGLVFFLIGANSLQRHLLSLRN